ncbi:MAG TPA: hypothetical protein VJT50_16100 [Pyrinomonadaceae bacterium]|nr:hypothetical protein [Pyrinomonadaceae bacterium]
MMRVFISLIASSSIVLGTPIAAALVLYRDSEAILPLLLYWPWLITDAFGIGRNCGTADDLADKFACIRTALIIDLVVYPTIIFILAYLIHRTLSRRLPNKSLDASGTSGLVIDNLSVTRLFPAASTPPLCANRFH